MRRWTQRRCLTRPPRRAFVVNVVVALVLRAVFRAAKVGNGTDITSEADYFADIGDPGEQAPVSEEKPIH